jgi:uncharacterized protein (TIGR03083 family)
VEVTAHTEALRQEGERMAAVVAGTDPAAAVPTCPEWTVRDLVRHLGGVHRWATGHVAGGRTEVWAVGLDEVVGAWPDDAELAGWLREGCTVLADALAAAPDDLECWTFLPAPSPRAMWARRQAHETAVHRMDAEMAAATAPDPFGATFAADGVDELLSGFVPRRSTGLRADEPVSFSVRCTDVDAAWALRIGPDGVTTTSGAASTAGSADASVLGAAADLYLALWNRIGPERLVVEGDPDVLAQFLQTVQVRWS